MTDEQKSKFCDTYCKYRERADQVIKIQKSCMNEEQLSFVRQGAERMLKEICNTCPMNEV